jgi:nucleotide-binding universal stress UspA family protein
LIVMGSHGFGFFNRLLLGSISLYVLRHGHRATLVVPRPDA